MWDLYYPESLESCYKSRVHYREEDLYVRCSNHSQDLAKLSELTTIRLTDEENYIELLETLKKNEAVKYFVVKTNNFIFNEIIS